MHGRWPVTILLTSLFGLLGQSRLVARDEIETGVLNATGRRVRGTVPVIVDFNGDWHADIVIGTTTGEVYAFAFNGDWIDGSPFELEGGVYSAPAVIDLNGDQRSELILTTDAGLLYAKTSGFRDLPGFPVRLDGALIGGPAAVDLEGQGHTELVVATDRGKLYVLTPTGRQRPPFPISLKGGVVATPAVGDLDQDGIDEIIVATKEGWLYALNRQGSSLPGFPIKLGFSLVSSPVLGDVDDDGHYEIVCTSLDYRVYAFKADTKPLPGFPVATGYRIYAPPALADLTGDGVDDIVVASGDRKLYALQGNGSLIPGFPVDLDGIVYGSPSIGDVDQDQVPDIIVGTGTGSLYIVKSDGKLIEGFPMSADSGLSNPLSLGDFDGDRNVEILVSSEEGRIYLWRLRVATPLAAAEHPWPTVGQNSWRVGRMVSTPSRIRHLGFRPRTLGSGQAITASYDFFDLDRSEPSPKLAISWYQNGQLVPTLTNQPTVPGSMVALGDRFRFELTALSGELKGQIFRSAEALVGNSRPTAPDIVISPIVPTAVEALVANVAGNVEDAEGDLKQVRFRWYRNGELFKEGFGLREIPPGETRRGDQWQVDVDAVDEEGEGKLFTRHVTIQNSPPARPIIRILPADPNTRSTLSVSLDNEDDDADHDLLSYRIFWYRNGVEMKSLRYLRDVLSDYTHRGERWEVRIEANDGDRRSVVGRAATTIRNAPPTTPRVKLYPEKPLPGDELRVELIEPASDPDGDAIQYRYAWFCNGELVKEMKNSTVVGSLVHPGDHWTVLVVPVDGTAEGGIGKVEVNVKRSSADGPNAGLQPIME